MVYSIITKRSGLQATDTHKTYLNTVNSVLDNPSLTKASTTSTPGVDYPGNGKAYIGPLKVTYSGGTPSITINSTEVKWVEKNNGVYGEEKEASTYVSGKEFYAVLGETTAKTLSNIQVDFKLNYTRYKTKVTLVRNGTVDGQNLMYHEGEELKGSLSESWEIEQSKRITIQKQDANGNALQLQGIKFEIYDAQNKKVATLTTKANGKTDSVAVEPNKTYTLKETINNNYGYKNRNITDAKITSGDGTISLSNGIVTFNLSEDSTISIKNTAELGKIAIQKKGANNTNLAGVKFAIYQSGNGANGWLKLNDASVTTPIVTTDTGINITGYSVTYVDTIEKATKFETNANGKIVINNLEIYLGVSNKYKYTVREIGNELYGYKNYLITDDNITVTGGNDVVLDEEDREVEFTITGNTTLEINNALELGKITIHKKGDSNTNLAGVKFAIYQSGNGANGWLKLNDASVTTPIKTTNTGLDITQYDEMEYVSQPRDATKFATNANGKIVINNLEIYLGKSNKYKYYVREIANELYGYNNCLITDDNIELTGGDNIELDEDAREVEFTISNNTTLEINNIFEVTKITISKKGENNTNLKDVQFAIWQTGTGANGWLKLDDASVTTPIVTTDTGIDITEYSVTYVNTIEEATKFKTNANGKIVINNLERYSGKDAEYTYWMREIENTQYGYKGMKITTEDITITGGTKEEVRPGTKEIHASISSDNTQITVRNTPNYGNIEITKVDKDDDTILLEDVGFKIKIDGDKYLQLIKDGAVAESVKGTTTINKNNVATQTEYSVKYVTDINTATIFKTDNKGKLIVENLEVYSGPGNNNNTPVKYKYSLIEVTNDNFGYTTDTSSIDGVNIELTSSSTESKKVTNEKELGGISLIKVDKDNENLVLENIEFVLSIDIDDNTYVALYNTRGLVKEVTGTAIINNKNQAKGSEYSIKYIKLDKNYLEYTEAEKNNLGITIFKTDSNGEILVNNLAVRDNQTNVKYKYRLTETYNPYYGYEQVNGQKYYETELVKGQISSSENNMTNLQEKFKVSGYVWIENPAGKSNGYDGVYDISNSNEQERDIKLTDLYITKNGKLIKNSNSTTGIEIKLRDTKTGRFIKEIPDEFTTNGQYTFIDIETAKMIDYEVVFVYDGFYYTTIVEQLDKDNGSKVKEVASERETLNSKFATIKNNNEVVSKDGKVNTVEYYKDGHTSTISKLNFDTVVTANTSETNYNLKEKYDEIKSNATKPVEVINNVNMGIVYREQPKISVNSDIYSALIEFNGYKYNYEYNGRQLHGENENDDITGVKFEEREGERYPLVVYSSDIQGAKDQNKEIKLDITYKIRIINDSRTVSVIPKQVINYFDSRYDIKAIGLGLDKTTHTVTDLLTYSTPQNVQGHPEYKSTIVEFNQEIQAGKGNVKYLYITFSVQRDAILDLLNKKSTYHNATEILSYASYYSELTSKAGNKQFITDQTESGEIYAGIDKASAPGNMEIVLKNHASGDGTKVLDTTNYEDDTTSAPSLLLEASEARKISGTVWEDLDERTNDQETRGNGIKDAAEKPIGNVQVELLEVNNDGSIGAVAKYSDGRTEIKTTTDTNGNYTFGYKDTRTNKYVGIMPGKYVVKYTYNNSSYIVGGKNLNVNDYKSTIIKSNVIKSAIEKQPINYNGEEYNAQRWYVIQELNRYSDAIDDLNYRKSLENNEVKYSTYQNSLTPEYNMYAYTPTMEIGIEFTKEDKSDALTMQYIKELVNIDFGIIERPIVRIIVEKDITGLEVVAQNGTSIIPEGDPSNLDEKMQYVKKLEGLVSAEIESGLLQGAKLNLEYTIKIRNESQIDYLEDTYYYYGTAGNQLRNIKIKKVVDYLDNTMAIEEEKNQETGNEWQTKTADDLLSQGLISQGVYNELKNGNYKILITEQFNELSSGEEKTVKLYATKYLAISDAINEENHTEIIELLGGRTIREAIPGNYNPATSLPDEVDDDKVELVITPPTGTAVDYKTYIISGIVTAVILVIGIAIIKKKIIK